MCEISVEIGTKPSHFTDRGQRQHGLAARIEYRRTECIDHGFAAVEGFQSPPGEPRPTNVIEPPHPIPLLSLRLGLI